MLTATLNKSRGALLDGLPFRAANPAIDRADSGGILQYGLDTEGGTNPYRGWKFVKKQQRSTPRISLTTLPTAIVIPWSFDRTDTV
jgi:hypothetical protein